MVEDIEGWPDHTKCRKKEAVKKEKDESTFNKRKFPMLDDIIGQEEAKKKGEDILLTFKKGYLLDYYGVPSTKGILLHGPPGTGKSMLIDALCNETDMMLFPLDFSVIGGIYVNSAVTNFVSYYNSIQAALQIEEERTSIKQYGIIFLDECEIMLGKRGKSSGAGSDEGDKLVNALCETIDGPYKDPRIMYIGTTNRRDLIDEAFLRAGRMDAHIEFKQPTKEDLTMMYYKYTHSMTKRDGKFNFRGLDYEELAERSGGFVGADVAYVMKESVRRRIFDHIEKASVGGRDLYVTNKRLLETIERHKMQKKEEEKIIGRIGF